MKNQPSRRTFLKKAGLTASVLPFTNVLSAWPSAEANALEVHIFSKHLQFLSYADMAKAAADIGFAGVELTVRPKGHVLPENVVRDLPKAVEAVRGQGLLATHMVSNLLNVEHKTSQQVLSAASEAGIKHYRLGYYSFSKNGSIPQDIKEANKQFKRLAKWNKKLGLKGAYQNHSGTKIGASIWDIWQILKGIDPAYAGCQYDIRHAVVEGGKSWEIGLRLIKDHIHSIVAKDFRWEKKGGKWNLLNTPLGEGMVDFKKYFSLLKKYNIKVPVSLHLEYPIGGGAEHGAKQVSKQEQQQVFKSMRKDLTWLQKTWQES
ncbi:MAG: sugar phosphate isomerase/epimerase [Saprospiraceae bacterium]|nr:sugar phosphate isomerase/epimerase [Saprospiraceae bacterium]